MRVPVIFFVAFFLVLGGWAALESSPTLRRQATTLWTEVSARFNGGGAGGGGANWGDVAAKIGEFANEERDLRRVIAPPPAPAAEAAPPAAAPAP